MLHGFADRHTTVLQHLHHSMLQPARTQNEKKIEKYCCYVMLTLSTVEFVSSHISPTKHKTYLLKTSLIMQTRTEENPWKYFQILQSYCCSPATFLPSMSHLCKGTGVDKKLHLYQGLEESLLQCND